MLFVFFDGDRRTHRMYCSRLSTKTLYEITDTIYVLACGLWSKGQNAEPSLLSTGFEHNAEITLDENENDFKH